VRELTAKGPKHEQQYWQHKAHWSPEHILMENGRDEDGRKRGNLIIHLAPK